MKKILDGEENWDLLNLKKIKNQRGNRLEKFSATWINPACLSKATGVEKSYQNLLRDGTTQTIQYLPRIKTKNLNPLH